MFGLVQVARAHVDLQQVLLPVARHDALLATHQHACHQREQVGRLTVWIHPFGEMTAIFQVTLFDQVAVGEQHRVAGLVGAQGHRVAGHDVRPVQEIGDAAEALGLALGEERVVADVQAHQLGVLGRRAGGEDLQLERVGALGQVLQHKLAAVHFERAARAVEHHAGQIQLVAVQAKGLRRQLGIAAQAHAVEHAGLDGVEVEGEIDGVDPVRGWTVVFAAGCLGGARGISKQHRVSPENLNQSVHRSPAPPPGHAGR